MSVFPLRTHVLSVGLASILLTAGFAADASAQSARIPGPPRFDVTLGGGLVTGVALGESDANLRANASSLQDYTLFVTETRLRPAPILDLRLAGVVTGRFAVEGQVHVGQPEMQTTITADKESAPDVTVSERLTQMLFAGGLRVNLGNPRQMADTVPYVSAGVGILRHAHEQGGETEQSPLAYVGGGVKRTLSVGRGGFPRLGVRGDVQLLMVSGGLTFEDKTTPQFSVSGGVFFTF